MDGASASAGARKPTISPHPPSPAPIPAEAAAAYYPSPSTDGPDEPSSPPSRAKSPVVKEEVVPSLRKRTSRRKPALDGGAWPCKVNGCNKEFAREADLKRHQRTTKFHSMPSFACQQCDATFTRTDALRRHQKSRHNGIVLEPAEQKAEGDENARSRSGTPSLKGKEKASGPSSHYRSHTVISPYIPPRLQQLPQPNDAGTQPPWPSAIAWANASSGAIRYIAHPVYQPSPYYRPHTVSYAGLTPDSQTQTETPAAISADSSRHASSEPVDLTPAPTSISDVVTAPTPLSEEPRARGQEITAAEVVAAVEEALRQAAAAAAVVSEDGHNHSPTLHPQYLDSDHTDHDSSSTSGSGFGSSISGYEDSRSSETSMSPLQSLRASADLDDMPAGSSMDLDMVGGLDPLGLENDLMGLHGYSSRSAYDEMEHIMTENGEPMLNPAELLDI